ncbi:hypothetical protein Efla_005333 [Eimeria flavescens]
MRLRFSCVAFAPPHAQLGVVGSPHFLGSWDPHRCVPLLPYHNAPAKGGAEPSLWFADIEIDEESLEEGGSSTMLADGFHNNRHTAKQNGVVTFADKLLSTMAQVNDSRQNRRLYENDRGARSPEDGEATSLALAATCRIDHRAPEIVAVLELHPLRRVQFEYKFILWTANKPATPYVPGMPGEAFTSSAYGSPSCTWRTWLFPPPPAQRVERPSEGLNIVWEGYGPKSNRRFSFDPTDVVVDESESGKLEVLYLCKIASFEDPRAGEVSEVGLTARFYNSVKAEGRIHYSRILPNLYVGSCPRQLQHIRHLKQDLKVTVIFNLQTADDLRANFPDPLASTRSPEAVSQLYESSGLRYVWMPTEDMSDAGRKLAVAQCALLLDALLQNGHIVYVHCNAGVGRSVAAVSAYLCFSVGLDIRKVNFLINAKRPVAYWDEKAIKSGVVDFHAKFGRGIKVVADDA